MPFALGAAGAALSGDEALAQGSGQKLEAAKSQLSTTETPTPFEDITTYNNFYEFGTDKGDPARNARTLKPRAVDRHDRRRSGQEAAVRPRRHPQGRTRSRSGSTATAAWKRGRW